MLSRRRLCLVLDLDYTLVNSSRFLEVRSAFEAARLQSLHLAELHREIDLYILPALEMWSKLRPFVHGFIKEASRLFELHVYTVGNRAYAQALERILDPLEKW
ncbi:hypothetical protein L7F22_033845 [Adiantum nelumboides]|nr:hypothetical protein [Adiantum nelumboides]